MDTAPLATNFRDELPGWILRGSLCALTSFGWAMAAGFNHPAEIAGMLSGIACWIAVFALLTSWLPRTMLAGWSKFGRALKVAAWMKFALSVLGLATLGFPASFSWLMTLDLLVGIAALSLVTKAGGFNDIEQIARLDSAGWTALTTIVDGALTAVLLATMALLVLAWWRLRDIKGEKPKVPAN